MSWGQFIGGALVFGLAIMLLVMTLTPDAPDPVIPDDTALLQFVSGTEYTPGQDGQVAVELLDRFYDPLTDANCSAVVYYPNKTIFVNQTMSVSAVQTYYTNFTIPSEIGVYEYVSTCERASKTYRATKSFHVSRARNLYALIEG